MKIDLRTLVATIHPIAGDGVAPLTGLAPDCPENWANMDESLFMARKIGKVVDLPPLQPRQPSFLLHGKRVKRAQKVDRGKCQAIRQGRHPKPFILGSSQAPDNDPTKLLG